MLAAATDSSSSLPDSSLLRAFPPVEPVMSGFEDIPKIHFLNEVDASVNLCPLTCSGRRSKQHGCQFHEASSKLIRSGVRLRWLVAECVLNCLRLAGWLAVPAMERAAHKAKTATMAESSLARSIIERTRAPVNVTVPSWYPPGSIAHTELRPIGEILTTVASPQGSTVF